MLPLYPARLKQDPRTRVNADGSVTDLMALDRNAKDLLPKLQVVTATGDVSLREYCVDMDQLNLSACAGNATDESVEILNNIAGYKYVPLSRLFVYNMARNQTGELANDNGTYIRICFDVLSRYGVCDEYLWPYDTTKFATLPSIMAMRQAVGHRIHSYYRIADTINPQDRLDGVITALRANHPVVFGTQITGDFQGVNDTTPQKPPTNPLKIVGGHALVIVGYIGGLFLIKNSWGTGWGDGGFCYMDPSYLTWGLSTDFWVPTLGMQFDASVP